MAHSMITNCKKCNKHTALEYDWEDDRGSITVCAKCYWSITFNPNTGYQGITEEYMSANDAKVFLEDRGFGIDELIEEA